MLQNDDRDDAVVMEEEDGDDGCEDVQEMLTLSFAFNFHCNRTCLLLGL